MLVTLPEETPVNEVVDLAHEIDTMGIAHLPLIVNGCWPDRPGLMKTPAMAARSHKLKLSTEAKRALESAARFGRARLDRQSSQIARLDEALDLPLITLPRLATPCLEPAHLAILADALIGGER